jgi:hypothetical protein
VAKSQVGQEIEEDVHAEGAEVPLADAPQREFAVGGRDAGSQTGAGTARLGPKVIAKIEGATNPFEQGLAEGRVRRP